MTDHRLKDFAGTKRSRSRAGSILRRRDAYRNCLWQERQVSLMALSEASASF